MKRWWRMDDVDLTSGESFTWRPCHCGPNSPGKKYAHRGIMFILVALICLPLACIHTNCYLLLQEPLRAPVVLVEADRSDPHWDASTISLRHLTIAYIHRYMVDGARVVEVAGVEDEVAGL